MKKALLCILLLIPQLLIAQRVVVLSVKQSPEFGFSVSKQDTTILKGSSVVLGKDVIVFGGSGEYSYKWSPNIALNDSVILHPVASPADTTAYVLTVTDKNGCSFSVIYTVNVKTINVKSNLIMAQQSFKAILFPNPNEGNFKVKLTGAPSGKIELAVYDNSGRIVKRHTILNFTGELTESFELHLMSGVYTLQISSGTETVSRQFVII